MFRQKFNILFIKSSLKLKIGPKNRTAICEQWQHVSRDDWMNLKKIDKMIVYFDGVVKSIIVYTGASPHPFE